jgi:hypothetical protein
MSLEEFGRDFISVYDLASSKQSYNIVWSETDKL